jgi:hypothetical protein
MSDREEHLVARLAARDVLWPDLVASRDKAQAENSRLTDALAASQAEVARLREALKPFAEEANELPSCLHGEDTYWVHLGPSDTGPRVRSDFSVSDLCRARAALAASQPQGGE